MSKYSLLGIIGGIAGFLTVVGYWAKITHQLYADKILTVGLWTLAVITGIYIWLFFYSMNKKGD